METNTRREPRYPFIAAAELLEENSGSRMSTQVSDLSLGGCYVDTVNPLPSGTAVQVKIFTQTHSFEAPATVVYSHTHLGMGVNVWAGRTSIRTGVAPLAAGSGGQDAERGRLACDRNGSTKKRRRDDGDQ